METKINDRFSMTIKTKTGDFNLSFPASASYQEAFNVTLQAMLNIYDLTNKYNAEVEAQRKAMEEEKANAQAEAALDCMPPAIEEISQGGSDGN